MAGPQFQDRGPAQLSEPANSSFAITPADGADLPYMTRALLLGAAGHVKVTYANGDIDTIPLQAGFNPVRVVRVWQSGTDATDIHGIT